MFSDQYIALKKVCVELGLRFGRCKEHALAILKEKGTTEPSKQGINKTLDKLEEEHHSITKPTEQDMDYTFSR